MSKSVTKKTHEIIKRELLNSLQENDDVEEQGLNERANNVNNSQEGIRIINRYEDIIKTQNKKQFPILVNKENFKKKFKNTENIFNNLGKSRSTIYFEISLY